VSDGEGRVAIVTGGAKGLGLAYTRALVREGYAVAIADLLDAKELVEELGPATTSVICDVGDPDGPDAMAQAVLDRFDRIDVLINNAGYFTQIHKRAFDELTVEEWDEAYRVNVRGTWLCCKAVVPAMREAGGGRIINTSSMTVPSGIPHFLHYVASKAAIVGLTRSLARELGDHNIAVNTISPDYVPHDPGYAGRQPEMAAIIANQRCFKRDETPGDLVGTILFLAGPGSAFITGQNFYVNGGRLFN
jgi:3-oxoacyl-[acyl-carrier protein] reductase